MTKTVYIGSGAGFAGDRLDAALPVIETLKKKDGPKYLIYEVMGERTLAIAQRIRMRNPEKGYSPYLEKYLEKVLRPCKEHGIRIVTNMGAANTSAAAKRVHEMAADQGIEGLRIAIVEGDDLLQFMTPSSIGAFDPIEGVSIDGKEIVAANAYLGARPVAAALDVGADIVLVGRTTDAALVLGPLIHEFGWQENELDKLAAGTLAGHLLECGGQVTGGYFSDPGFKDVPGMAQLGFPIGEVDEAGGITIGKAEDTGGLVTTATVTEQILYEMHDPTAYVTPDVILDVSGVILTDEGPDRIGVKGAKGKAPPDTLKVTVSADGGWLGEAEMIYAGPNALARAREAANVVQTRAATSGVDADLRIDIFGLNAVFDPATATAHHGINERLDGEYRVRAAVRTNDKATAEYVNDEVLSLFCSGPAGGGGYRCSVTGQVNTSSILIPREGVEGHTKVREVFR